MGKILEFNDVTKRYAEYYEGAITKVYKLSYPYDMIYYHISFYVLVQLILSLSEYSTIHIPVSVLHVKIMKIQRVFVFDARFNR